MDQFDGQVDSPATTQDHEGATAEAEAPEGAETEGTGVSPTPEGDSPFDIHDIVNQHTSDAEGEEGKAEAPAADASEDDPDGESDEEVEQKADEDLPFHKHPRFQEVIAQKNEFKTQAEQSQQQLEGFQREVQELFSGLDQQEVTDALEIARLMKTDPQAAFEKLNPVYHRAASMNGYILPEDLQREVDAGYVTSERAQELARLRAQSEFQQTRSQQAQQQRHQQESQSQMQAGMQEATQGLEALEAQWRSEDPDYASKQGQIFDRFAVLMQQHVAQGNEISHQVALDMANKAKQETEERLGAFRPKRQPKKAIRSTPGGGSAKAKPQSVMDIINAQSS